MSDASIQSSLQSVDAQVREELHGIAAELPEAREKLLYVRSMTEKAATKVLDLVEKAQNDAETVRKRGMELSDAISRLAMSNEFSLERARTVMKLCAAYAADAASFAAREKSLHTEIMMSQDFQDLSGQVINKVMKMLERMETPLHHVLGDQPKPGSAAGGPEELAGVQTPDKALQQDDVDDLLSSFGF